MPEPALIIEACAGCRRDLEHCHGTAIVHGDGAGDCTEDPGCRLGAEQHPFSISCSEVECPCGAPIPAAGWPRRTPRRPEVPALADLAVLLVPGAG